MKRASAALALLLAGATAALAADRRQPETEAVPPLWSSGKYEYDGAGNIKSIGTTASPNGDGRINNYVYDGAGRLVSAGANYSTLNSETYEYDAFGNLTKITTTTPAGTVPTTFTIDSSTNRVSSATYDPGGNMTSDGLGQTFTYDALGSITQKTLDVLTEQYIYTAGGERIAVRQPLTDQWKWTLRGFDDKVLREYKSAGLTGSLTWMEDYIYRDSLLAAAVRPSAQGGTRHFHLDHLGTPRLITDAHRYAFANHDYFPFGAEVTSFRQEMLNRGLDRPEPMKFTGHERDFANTAVENRTYVDYMHARYSMAGWGRFLSVDPILGDARAPQTWNRYAYANNNPINLTDPTGMCEQKEGEPPCSDMEITVNGNDVSDQEHYLWLQAETKETDEPFRGDPFSAHLFPNALWMSYQEKQQEKLVGHPVTPGAGAMMMMMMMVGPGGAQNVMNGSRLARQLVAEEAASVFTAGGGLTQSAISGARMTHAPGTLGNPAIPSGFGKFSTGTINSPSGPFQVHFYMNPQTGEVNYLLDYKVVFNVPR